MIMNDEMDTYVNDNHIIGGSCISCNEEGQGDSIESELQKSIDPLVLAIELKNIDIFKMLLENNDITEYDINNCS